MMEAFPVGWATRSRRVGAGHDPETGKELARDEIGMIEVKGRTCSRVADAGVDQAEREDASSSPVTFGKIAPEAMSSFSAAARTW